MGLENEFNGNSVGLRKHAEVGENIAERVTLETALNKTDDSITSYPKGATPVLATQATDTAIMSGSGQLIGFYVNSTSSGTLVLKDGTSTDGTAKSGTITPAVGYHAYPMALTAGLFVDFANTINVTFFVIAN